MKRFLAFFLLFTIGMNVQAKEEVTQQELYATTAVLMDADSGRILFGKEEEKVLPMASTTKIMTCILALENGADDQIITVSENAASQPKVHLGMRKGQQYYLRDLYYSMMLESHNDTAVAIAEGISGSVEKFAEEMNDKAEAIGCENTYFITPNGLDDTDQHGMHSTTAADLAKIMRYCITESECKNAFIEITGTSTYQFTDLSGQNSYSCINKNSFLSMMDGAFTGKTGFTGKAGYCYVGALKREDRTFIVSLLACGWPNNKTYKWKDTKVLMEYALENYNYEFQDEKEEICVKVKQGIGSSDNPFKECYIWAKTKSTKILKSKSEELSVVTDYDKEINAPVKAGTKIGSKKYYIDTTLVEETPVYVDENIEKKTLQWYWNIILSFYML